MNFKKVVFLPDPEAPQTQEACALLKKDFSCFESRNTDEYDQVFQQSGPFVLLFSDAKSALSFLKDEAKPLSRLNFKVFLFLAVNGAFNADAQKKLSEFRINVYPRKDLAKLVSDIKHFLESKEGDSMSSDDLEFIMPGDE